MIETSDMWVTEVVHNYRNFKDYDILRIETHLARKRYSGVPGEYVLPTPDFSQITIDGIVIFRWDYT